MRTRSQLLVAVLAAIALVVAACEADTVDDEPDEPEDPVEEPDEPDEDEAPDDEAPDEEAPEDEEAAVVLSVGDTDVGTHLVDAEGLTLYLFTQDPPGESVCEDDCAATWPPLTVDGEVGVDAGVDEGLVDTITRGDGTEQVTYADQPLYYFAADGAAGDVEGQGINDVWFVVAPDGSAIDGGGEAADDDGGGMGY